MFLLLDVVSPIPEFHLIDDKKIRDSVHILNNVDEKLSDKLVSTYLNINNSYKLYKNIKKLIITIGPGSYTALRVGASFIAGLSQSMDLPVAVISTETIYNHIIESGYKKGIYFESSNKQIFFSYKKETEFIHEKVDNQNYSIPNSISLIFYNNSLPSFINSKISLQNFSIMKSVIQNLHRLEFNKNKIIRPIHVSNNIILN